MNEMKQENLTENEEIQNSESRDTALQITETPLRTYKDRLFRMLFKDKEKFLELYNAMNDTSYDNPKDLIVTTLENAIYMGMKNDVSFLLYDQLLLYEHQSTKNPNIPLRNLFYVANVYSALLKDEDLFSTVRIPIPYPKFVVFYNGKSPMPEKEVLRLSDSYETKKDEIDLELKVLVLNINKGYNNDLMDKCKTLREYMIYTSTVRKYSESLPLSEAVDRAISECIRAGVLKDFLEKNKAEVRSVSIFEYDEEKHMRNVQLQGEKIGEKRGFEIGEKHGREIGEKIGENRLGQLMTILINEGKRDEVALVAKDEKARQKYYEKYHLTDTELSE